MMRFSGSSFAVAACLALAPLAASAQTESWPQRNVQFMLPFGPGSATDIAARLIGERLQAKWGKGVVVENRAGGDGLIAIRAFLSAKDDHVLLYASSASFIAHPYTLPEKPPYDLAKDFAPIARVADTLLAIGAPASLGVDTLADWVKMAKAQPGKMNGAGAPGLPDLALQAFFKSNDLQAT
ncbi:MAG TPA: tripartite tricarboxylate transporter substrate-binding protein, partial [Beijerinckiaceae bacterium]